MGSDTPQSGRIASLDQFRGYTVLGMFLVNFIGSYLVTPAILKHHHTYCSYADTIMPHFFFAVGLAYRLTFLKRLETVGAWRAYLRVARRSLGLILVGAVLYHLDGRMATWAEVEKLGFWGFLTTAFQRNLFQTLVHIGVTTLWVLPVIAARPSIRIAFACFSGLLFLVLSWWFYYEWVMKRPGIDGGPFGFLTWTIPLIVGTLACDTMQARPDRAPLGRFLLWGALLMLAGYAVSCLNRVTPPNQASLAEPLSFLVEPPFVPPSKPANLWTMSMRAGSVSYLIFGAGLSLVVYAFFVVICDVAPRLRGASGAVWARTLGLGVAWAMLVLGSVALACGTLGLILHAAGAGVPGADWLGTGAAEQLASLTSYGWGAIVLGSALTVLIGWDLRRSLQERATLVGAIFAMFGGNALAAYIIHELVSEAIKPFTPKDAPLWYVLGAFALFLAICFLFLRYLEKNRLFLRL